MNLSRSPKPFHRTTRTFCSACRNNQGGSRHFPSRVSLVVVVFVEAMGGPSRENGLGLSPRGHLEEDVAVVLATEADFSELP